MIDLAQIHPVSDFVRNYKAFLARIKETGNPEVLTVNGRAEYVLLDAATYQAMANQLEQDHFVRAVNEGIADMDAGCGQGVKETFADLRQDLGL